jgi:hypothetical protein
MIIKGLLLYTSITQAILVFRRQNSNFKLMKLLQSPCRSKTIAEVFQKRRKKRKKRKVFLTSSIKMIQSLVFSAMMMTFRKPLVSIPIFQIQKLYRRPQSCTRALSETRAAYQSRPQNRRPISTQMEASVVKAAKARVNQLITGLY